MINNKYTYPELIRVEKNDVRYYQDSKENLVTSVTTILSATGDHSGIDAWKRRVGPKTAKEVVLEATTIGTAVHLAIENYLNGVEWQDFSEDRLGLMAHQIAKRFVDDCLVDIEEVWGLESGLVVDGLYAGTADCIGVFKGRPTIIDFKTSRKPKREEWIDDYFMQTFAYALMFEEMTGVEIKQIVILVACTETFDVQVFKKPSKDADEWLEKLIKIMKDNPHITGMKHQPL